MPACVAATAANPGRVAEMAEATEILQKTREYVLSQMAKNDAAHDADHVLRVVALTETLCKAYPQANAFRAQLLAWLHDLSDDKLNSNVGASSVAQVLESWAVEEGDIRFLTEALPYISYRKHPKLSPEVALEIRIVQDADRMDAMGAVGIARTFAYGGAKGRSLENSLAHFDEKLLRLYDLLSTEEAKRIALPRHRFLQAFYAQFAEECK
jgi:uncharacterized protein